MTSEGGDDADMNTGGGGLSFIVETGSGPRDGGRSVRSQAAKFGWNPRAARPLQLVQKSACVAISDSGHEAPPPLSSEDADQGHGLNFIFETGFSTGKRNSGARSHAARYGRNSEKKVSKRTTADTSKRRKLQHNVSFGNVPGLDLKSTTSFLFTEPDQSATPARKKQHSSQRAGTLVAVRAWDRTSCTTHSPSTPLDPNSECSCQDEQAGGASRSNSVSPYHTRPDMHFFEVVLNEEYPLFLPLDDAYNPFAVYPVPWDPMYGFMINRYRSITLARSESSPEHDFKQSMCELPLQIAIQEADPALFFISIGAAAAVLEKEPILLNTQPYSLQSAAITLLNDALANPDRPVKSSTILTVVLLAMVEGANQKIAGRGNLTAVYQTAAQKMVTARGGLENIFYNDVHGPRIVRLLTRCDSIICKQVGGAVMFPRWTEEILGATKWEGVWDGGWEETANISL